MSDDKVLSAIDLAESECRAWLGAVAVNGSVSGAANARMHRMFQAIRDSLVERAGEPVACETCGGSGQEEVRYTVARCCGRQMANGDCCGNPEPDEDFHVEPCADCGGSGEKRIPPPTAPGASHER